MNLTFYSRSFSVLGLPSEVPSLKITQSFIMGMHSSIVAGVKLETLITYRCISPLPPRMLPEGSGKSSGVHFVLPLSGVQLGVFSAG